MDTSKIEQAALDCLNESVKMSDPADINKLKEAIAKAIAVALAEYDKSKN